MGQNENEQVSDLKKKKKVTVVYSSSNALKIRDLIFILGI